MRYMGEFEGKARLTIKLQSPFTGTQSSASASVLEDGRIDLDLYDFSDEAQSSMGNDVAWIWRIETAHKPRLLALLEERTGTPIRDDQAMLNAFAQHFRHVHAIRDWLKEKGIPYEEKFDSWA
jgi:hypothetical protein